MTILEHIANEYALEVGESLVLCDMGISESIAAILELSNPIPYDAMHVINTCYKYRNGQPWI